jgi:hypothetical protein
VWVVDVIGRLLRYRWPILGVAPAFAYAGYTGWQVLAFTVLAIVLAELAFAVVKVLVLDREY